jgi:sugar diacid utilization regulator
MHRSPVNVPAASGDDETDGTVAKLLTRLPGLQAMMVLAMGMADTGDEREILQLAQNALASFDGCQFVGMFLVDGGWETLDARSGELVESFADLAPELAVLGSAGGAVDVGPDAWGWAYAIRRISADFAFFVVRSDSEPPAVERFLLRVLAQQTGVAFGNARALGQQRRLASTLLSANAELVTKNEALERSAFVHERLTSVVTAGEGQQGIARALWELTGFPAVIEDRHGNPRAYAGPGSPVVDKRSLSQREHTLRRGIESGVPMRDAGRLMVVVNPRDEFVGVLALHDPDGVAGEVARLALQHAATVLAVELARLWSIAETELRLGRDLVDELLSGTDEADAIARAQAVGYDPECTHRAVVVDIDVLDRQMAYHAVRRVARDQGVGTLSTTRGQFIVVLADTDRPWESFRAAVASDLHAERCRVGVGSAVAQTRDLPHSLNEAMFALRVQAEAGGPDQATSFDDLGVYRLLAGLEDFQHVERFTDSWLGSLLAYDARKESSDLVTTLFEYLRFGGNYDAAAHALLVHRSTLKYRLQRIREISGHDLSSPEILFNLQLALHAWRTLRIVRDPSLM